VASTESVSVAEAVVEAEGTGQVGTRISAQLVKIDQQIAFTAGSDAGKAPACLRHRIVRSSKETSGPPFTENDRTGAAKTGVAAKQRTALQVAAISF
jgi:hypothetical protein